LITIVVYAVSGPRRRVRPQCANTGHSPAAWRTGQINGLILFGLTTAFLFAAIQQVWVIWRE
jgi:hypothetical protein